MGYRRFLVIFLCLLFVVPSALALMGDLGKVQERLFAFANVTNETTVIVLGSHLSASERLLYSSLGKEYPELSTFTVLQEDDVPAAGLNKTLLLIGGPSQNALAATLLAQCTTVDSLDLVAGRALFLEDHGRKYVLFSDTAGFTPTQTARYTSPLARIMPVALVPVAAAAIGVFLFWLFRLLSMVLPVTFKGLFANKLFKTIKKKGIKEEFTGGHIGGVRFKVRELVAILVASIIFSVSISYLYFTKEADMLLFVGSNIIINLCFQAIRNGARLHGDKRLRMHTEYRLWYVGAFVTLLTGWLGETFSLAGYVLVDDGSVQTGLAEGRLAFLTDLFLFGVFLLFFVWSLVSTSPLVSMVAILAISGIFLDMLPFEPFSGKSMHQWSKGWYWPSFLVVGACYVGMLIV